MHQQTNILLHMNNDSGIYKITSPSNKIYIGETINFEKRFHRYNTLQCKQQFKLYNSFKKYGVENHIFEIIEICEKDNLKCRERYWQDYYNVLSDNGMNLTLTSCDEKKRIWAKEVHEKMVNKLKEGYQTGRLINPFKGKKHSKDSKLKMSEANSGEDNPMYGKFGKDHPRYGHRHSENTKRIMSENRGNDKNPNSKIVLDTATGIFYLSVGEISTLFSLNRSTLTAKLNGQRKNNTNFKYC